MSIDAAIPSDSGRENPAAPSTRGSLKSGGTYALANAAQRALAFVLLPLYVTVLLPAEYGRLGLLIAIQSGATVALAAGMEAAVMRRFFALVDDPRQQRRFVLSAWGFLLSVVPSLAAVAAVCVLVLAPSSDVFRPGEAALAICVAATFVAATVVPLTVLRAEQRLRDFVILTAAFGIATTLLTLLFVVVLRWGVVGWLVASVAANLLSLFVAMAVLPWSRVDQFDREGVRAAVAIAMPLAPHAASQWALQLADRILLAALVTPSALGIYTLGANLAVPALVLVQSMNYGFMPAYASSKGRPESLRSTITLQVTTVLMIGNAIAVMAPPIVSLVSSDYAGASGLVPWLVLGYIFVGLYYIPMNAISLILGRTSFVWILSLTSVIISLVALYALVPGQGVTGAAEASALGYLILFALTTIHARRLGVRLSIDWRRIMSIGAVAGLAYVIGTTMIPVSGLLAVIARGLLIVGLSLTIAKVSGRRLWPLRTPLNGTPADAMDDRL